MNEYRLLAIETSSVTGSVALADGEALLEQTIPTPREQTERLLGLIDELFAETGMALSDLDAIVFGRGPGSFTGIRIAAAAAQGLSLASDVGVVPVSSLAALAQRGLGPAGGGAEAPAAARALCCVDARMGEVYSACFTFGDGLVRPDAAETIGLPGRVLPPMAPYVALGDGLTAYPQALAAVVAGAAAVDAGLFPRARDLVPLAAAEVRAGRFVPYRAALPVYLRDAGAWRRNGGRA